jgi:hypothetical protein
MKRTIILASALLLLAAACSADGQPEADLFSYDSFAALLESAVDDDGLVDYVLLKKRSGELDAFAEQLAQLKPAIYKEWNKRAQLAFWINAYNALTLKLIVDRYPVKSIRDIPGAWEKVIFTVAGEKLTLDTIEHSIIREQFNEPRIHVALVCAAVSCPPLRREPFVAEKLEEQLADQSRRFLESGAGMRIDNEKGVISLSAIFDWFGEDFKKGDRDDGSFEGYNDIESALLHFIGRNVDDTIRKLLPTRVWKIKYHDYDWSLNRQPPAEQ